MAHGIDLKLGGRADAALPTPALAQSAIDAVVGAFRRSHGFVPDWRTFPGVLSGAAKPQQNTELVDVLSEGVEGIHTEIETMKRQVRGAWKTKCTDPRSNPRNA